MQSKISQLTAFATVAAFAAGPVFALDAHLVPVPTGEVTTEAAPVEDVAGDVAAEASGLPKIPWAELNGFPHPIPGAEVEEDVEEGEDVEATGTEETRTAMTWSTWCPEPTVFTWGSATISVETATWVTLTDCPESSSSSSSATSTETESRLSCLTEGPTHTLGRRATRATASPPRSHPSPRSSQHRTPSPRSPPSRPPSWLRARPRPRASCSELPPLRSVLLSLDSKSLYFFFLGIICGLVNHYITFLLSVSCSFSIINNFFAKLLLLGACYFLNFSTFWSIHLNLTCSSSILESASPCRLDGVSFVI
ncbi:hypothetical protein V8F06_006040 [Rhypophila decipiens]